MTLPSYTCELDPETSTTLKLYLFKNVQNVEEIRNHVVKGEWNCAIVKPSLIYDPLQIAVAANKAVVAEKMKTLVTRTVHGEILYNLSLTKNISQSLSSFGVQEDTDMLVCILDKESDRSENIIPLIKGDLCSISELEKFTDIGKLKKCYKLNNIKSDVDLLDIIVSRIVTKSFVSH